MTPVSSVPENILDLGILKSYEQDLSAQMVRIKSNLDKLRKIISILQEDEKEEKPYELETAIHILDAPSPIATPNKEAETNPDTQSSRPSYPLAILEFLRHSSEPLTVAEITDLLVEKYNLGQRSREDLSGIVSPALSYYLKKDMIQRLGRGIYIIKKENG